MVYIVWDFVSGVPLSEWLVQERPTFRRAAKLCVSIAHALDHAHETGIVHRDLKPQNIMVDAEDHPHLMDFGLARREAGETTMTTDGQVLGTPAYMSPEQARGESHRADRRTDVYSLGVILFELLSGELPFRGTARMIIQQVLYEEPSSPRRLNSTIPKDLDTIVVKAMAKEPHRRYATARQMADDLQRFLDSKPIVARRTGPLDHLWRWSKRQPAIASLAAAVVALLVFLAIAGPLVAWKQRSLTNQQKLLTDQQKLLTEQQRRQLYVSDVNTAHNAWREANLGRARQLLARHQWQGNEEDLRGFEWYYLWTQLEDVALTPKLDHNDVRSMAISPDGKLMATGGRQPAIKLWDLRAPQPRQ
jgi:serine/threonine protein kinase